jgi:hypothetical protein
MFPKPKLPQPPVPVVTRPMPPAALRPIGLGQFRAKELARVVEPVRVDRRRPARF